MELFNVFSKYILCASRILFFCYGNNVVMAIEKYVYDCATTQLFLTESCAEIIASGASC